MKADAFTDRIVKMYQFLTTNRYESIMTKQILRSGTSIGANVAESINAQSTADFINKLHTGGYLKDSEFESMEKDVIEIIKLLTSIIKTKKRNTESLDSHK